MLDKATVVPALNQIEVHPYFTQPEVRAFGERHGILTQAWAPIGGITFYRDSGHRSTLQDPTIGAIDEAHGKTPAQVMLRWHDFDLTTERLAAIDGLDTGRRGGPEPADITLKTFGRPIPEA